MKVLAAVLAVLAVLISVVPQFTDCQSQGRALTLEDGRQVPMKCHWTAQGELVLGVPLFAVGALAFFSQRKETRRFLGIIGVVLGVFVILLPTVVIGVCGMPTMVCVSIMKPAMILAGILVVGISLAITGLSLGRETLPE